jgi:hypothetical protein
VLKVLGGLAAGAMAVFGLPLILLATALAPGPGGGTLNWTVLAACESSNNPRAISPNGLYFGLYQFDLPTWKSYGGQGSPIDSAPSGQTAVAYALYLARGTQPWPVCGHFLTDMLGARTARAPQGQPLPGGLAVVFPWVPAGGYADPFPWGQCTYWAAYNHLVSWNGNATDWFANAAAQGARESPVPVAGSIVVYGSGSAYSVFGHVGLVVAVGSGSFQVSEMNYIGVGRVDTRWNVWPDSSVEGFIL